MHQGNRKAAYVQGHGAFPGVASVLLVESGGSAFVQGPSITSCLHVMQPSQPCLAMASAG